MGGSCQRDLSDEYTTALLEGDVDTALAAASFGGYGSCSGVYATFTRTGDELTIAKQAVDGLPGAPGEDARTAAQYSDGCATFHPDPGVDRWMVFQAFHAASSAHSA